MKRSQKEQLAQIKAQPKAMKKPVAKQVEKPAAKKFSGWRSFIDRYCSL